MPSKEMKIRYKSELLSLYLTLFIVSFTLISLGILNPYIIIFIIIFTGFRVLLMKKYYLGNYLIVNKIQFPDIYSIAQECSRRLYIKNLPVILIEGSSSYNAMTFGFFKHYMVLYSKVIEDFTPNELAFIIGHELGHEKFDHTKWSILTGPLKQNYIDILFNFWSHKAEYTADRCGLIACRDLSSAISAFLKLSVGFYAYKRMNIKEFLKQIEEIEKGRVSKLSELLGSHPFIINRIKQMIDFYYSDIYKEVTDGKKGFNISPELVPTIIKTKLPEFTYHTHFKLLENNNSDYNLGGILNISLNSREQFNFHIISKDGLIEGLNLKFYFSDDKVKVKSDNEFKINSKVFFDEIISDGDIIEINELFIGMYRSMRFT